MSIYDFMAAYQLETGLPPLGSHRALADHVMQRFAVTCESCKGTGAQYLFGEPVNCAECRGWRKHLSPAAVRRLHQIVIAAFPSIRAGCATEITAQRWAARKSVPATRPMYLGVAALPASIPQAPVETALAVCSLTWRRGLRSEFLWSGGNAGPCILWERLPDLTHHDGALWSELFAWTPARHRRSRSIRSPSIATWLGKGKFGLQLVGCAQATYAAGFPKDIRCHVRRNRLRAADRVGVSGCRTSAQLRGEDMQRWWPRPSDPRRALRGISDPILLPLGPPVERQPSRGIFVRRSYRHRTG